MTFVEFQPQARSAQKRSAKVVRRAPVGPEGMEMRGVEVACVERELSRREGSCTSLGSASRAQKEGVHIVQTLGFGLSCTGVILVRIGEVFGGVAVFLGERLVRVPPRARVFPVQGLASL